jgi:hypothetical protein
MKPGDCGLMRGEFAMPDRSFGIVQPAAGKARAINTKAKPRKPVSDADASAEAGPDTGNEPPKVRKKKRGSGGSGELR